ncbi:MAG: LysR family transcriptional regulator, partial [Myxococcota bacterium]
GDRDPRLERVPDAPLQWGESLWVLTHEALRNSARVRVVLDAITAALVAERPSIEGSAYAPEAPQHRE